MFERIYLDSNVIISAFSGEADTGLSGVFQLEHWRAGETARSTSVEVIRPDIATLALVTQWLTA